jgi:hypothetical protein
MYLNPGDYAAIQFIRARTAPDARILEAPGTQYQYYGRISTNTGRPALGGWLVHATSWRGARFEPIRDARIEMAKRIYETRDARLAFTLLLGEEIRYIIVGDAERGMYPILDEEKFALLGKRVFRFEGTSVYEVNPKTDVTTLPVPPTATPLPARGDIIDIPDFLASVTTGTAATTMTTAPATPTPTETAPTMPAEQATKRPATEDTTTTVPSPARANETTTASETTTTASR